MPVPATGWEDFSMFRRVFRFVAALFVALLPVTATAQTGTLAASFVTRREA